MDLAWQSEKNHTGVAAFRGDARRVSPVAIAGVHGLEELQAFLDEHETRDSVVAIDAPLIITNERGQRPCERRLSQRFARFHAGAHPSNRRLYPEAGSVELALRLRSRGYRHCTLPGRPWQAGGRWICEVYPHPAQVVLFERSRILKYKRGAVAARRAGLRELRDELRARVFGPGSPFRLEEDCTRLFEQEPAALRGGALKQHEDRLDALLCAYLAFHLWRWGWSRSEIFGDHDQGYIVVPTTALPKSRGRS